jgi:hypothetical protein
VDPGKAKILFEVLEFLLVLQLVDQAPVKFQFLENSRGLEEASLVSWRATAKAQSWIDVQVGNLVQVSADQVHIVHIFH